MNAFEQQVRNADPGQTTTEITENEVMRGLKGNEDGDAYLFTMQNQGLLTYDHATGDWYVWQGHYWKLDLNEQSLARIQVLVEVYEQEALRQTWARTTAEKKGRTEQASAIKAQQEKLMRRIRDLQTIRRKQNVLHLARAGDDSLGISGDEWDGDPWRLGVLNGVIDLKTGEHRPGRPGDYIRTVAPVEWQGLDASCYQWTEFLKGVFDGDMELINFMQRLMGSALCGEPLDHVIAIFWGSGRNGKTVLLQAVGETLGDLAGPVEGELLLENRLTRPSGGPTSDLLHLQGKRFVWLSETNENRRLNPGRLKLLTGGDMITGRAPYAKRQITFRPTHSLFLCTNHKPRADATDYALWKRVLLIPFTQRFVEDPQEGEKLADRDMPSKLRAECAGILSWLVAGCLEWQQRGLRPPRSVMAATQSYRESEDTIRTFIDDCCLENTHCRAQAGSFYQAYRAWAEGNGDRPVSNTKFGRYMSDSYDHEKDNAGKFYIGIGLKRDGL